MAGYRGEKAWNAELKEKEDRDYSPVEADAIAFDRAMAACHHWIYYCEEVELLSNCE